jgi:hypothetical protein
MKYRMNGMMKKLLMAAVSGLLALQADKASAQAEKRAYIGYVYPAGGQQGTTFSARLGGQRIDGVCGAVVSGQGVHAKLIDSFRRLNPQEYRLVNEQLQLIKKDKTDLDETTQKIKKQIELRMAEYVRQPASESLATVVLLEITVDEDAAPGPREIRVMTPTGISNPLLFYVGRLPEFSLMPMKISLFQTLGKEQLALRKRSVKDEETPITLPCTVNGQIASGEINRYRFSAGKGDRLVISTLARQLIPYIADAVPGWFQPVLSLRNADGDEIAYNDDYQFNPDPVILCEIPKTGEYVLSVTDAIYRGREDFVYRITIGQTPFITSIFPPGARVGEAVSADMDGWNLDGAKLVLPGPKAEEGLHPVSAELKEVRSNLIPFALDTLPECIESRSNNDRKTAQEVTLPVIVNGRIETPGDQDIFRFTAQKGDILVAEVNARRLNSPLDSLLTLTDSDGRMIAINDDHSDPGSGLNTHHADSYIRTEIPADGTYYVSLTDTAHHGGPASTYRLRLSPPQPDFALRTEPSHFDIRNNNASVNIYAIRKDGFNGPITLRLTEPATGFDAKPVTLPADAEKIPFAIRYTGKNLKGSIPAAITGTALIDGKQKTRQAVPAEDWMQAFLWRHLVPAQELVVYRYERSMSPPVRTLPTEPDISPYQGNFKDLTPEQKQVVTPVKQTARLYEDWLLTDDLYKVTIKSCLDFTTGTKPEDETAPQKKDKDKNKKKDTNE